MLSSPLPLWERVHSECYAFAYFYVKNGQREALAYGGGGAERGRVRG